MINIIGLGTQDKDVSLRGYELIKNSKQVILKTEKIAACNFLKTQNIKYESLDYIFEQSQNFDELNQSIVEKLLGYKEDICYLVEKTPQFDTSVQLLLKNTCAKVNIVGGVLSPHFMNCNATILSAYDLPNILTFSYDRSMPIVVYDIDSKEIAGQVKLFLCEVLGDEEECEFSGKSIRVYELDRQKAYSSQSVLTATSKDITNRRVFNFYDVIAILQILRSKDGCPWDKAQTHETLKKNLLEECNELIEAIDKSDFENMQEECGDVLLQPLFHASIAYENNEFSYADVINTLCKKLITRHSHIFGDDKAENAEQALEVWRKNKRKEKGEDV